jgi:hypothetical protein
VSAKTLTLLRKGRFFKEYQAVELRLPVGFRTGAAPAPPKQGESEARPAEPAKAVAPVNAKNSKKRPVATPPLPPGELTLTEKAAWVDGRRVASSDLHFISADKWLIGSRPGFNIRALPAAKPVGDPGLVTTSTKSGGSAAKNSRPAKAAKVMKPVPDTADEEDFDPVLETGVFLAREDIEELFTIIRPGTKVRVVK